MQNVFTLDYQKALEFPVRNLITCYADFHTAQHFINPRNGKKK
jgi:hypothetical protein